MVYERVRGWTSGRSFPVQNFVKYPPPPGWGFSVENFELKPQRLKPPGVLPEKLRGGVRPAPQNPYPIYDQNLRNSLPYLWPDP